MQVSRTFTVEYSVDSFVEKLLFAELQSAETSNFWRDMVLSEAAQELLPHEYQYLEDLAA